MFVGPRFGVQNLDQHGVQVEWCFWTGVLSKDSFRQQVSFSVLPFCFVVMLILADSFALGGLSQRDLFLRRFSEEGPHVSR